MPTISANNITLYYEIAGAGEPLLLISGLSGDHNAWAKMLPFLTPYYTVITLDNRGVGQSDAPDYPYNTTMMAEDTIALLKALNIQRAHIVGHSLGAAIGQQIALHHADCLNKLILAGGFARFDETGQAFIDSRALLMQEKLSPEHIVTASIPWLYGNTFIANPENIELAKARVCSNPFPQTLLGYQHQSHACKTHNTTKLLGKINTPTLVLFGTHDLLVKPENADYLASKIPNAKLQPIEDSAHMFTIEKGEETAKYIRDFCH